MVDILQKELKMCGTFLPFSISFSTLDAFKRSIVSVDVSSLMKCNTD